MAVNQTLIDVVLNKNYSVNQTLAHSFTDDSHIRREMNEFIPKVNFWLTIPEIIMFVCGILGNTLALIVINRRSLRDTSSSVFITYLAIFDISVLTVHITTLACLKWTHSYIIHCCLTYLTDLVSFCSVWTMVIMTLDRCIAVRSPFLAKRFCTTENARYSIYIMTFLAFVLFSSTFPVIYNVDKIQQKCGVQRRYQTLIRVIKPTIFFFVPDVLLLANFFVIYELFMATRKRKTTLMNPENAVNQLNTISFNRKQQQLTIMLVTVSLSFYIFTTPAIIDYIRQLHPPNHHDIKKLKKRFLVMNLTVLWYQMSSATNFIFYCLAGSKFRAASAETIREFYEMIRSKCSGENNHDYINSQESKRSKSTNMRMTQLKHKGIKVDPATEQSNLLATKSTRMKNSGRDFSSKRNSIDTLASSQSNRSRMGSKCESNFD